MRWNSVGPNFFTTLGVPIRLGRDFTEADGANAAKVAIVNETFARTYFGKREPLGHQVSFTPQTGFTVVGLVADSNTQACARNRCPPLGFHTYTQAGGGTMHVELRTAGDPTAFWPAIRRLRIRAGPPAPAPHHAAGRV
jgi:hypothetical protein